MLQKRQNYKKQGPFRVKQLGGNVVTLGTKPDGSPFSIVAVPKGNSCPRARTINKYNILKQINSKKLYIVFIIGLKVLLRQPRAENGNYIVVIKASR